MSGAAGGLELIQACVRVGAPTLRVSTAPGALHPGASITARRKQFDEARSSVIPATLR